jgi:hypothetical protein
MVAMQNNFNVGDIVQLVDEYCEPVERSMRYIIVENNGDRLVIEAVCGMSIKPAELVRPEHIRIAK